MCFNVIYPTVSGMLLFISVLAGTAAVAVWIGVLVCEGFRHADVPCDVRVRVRTLPAEGPGAAGRWVEVTLANPSTGTALVALGLRRARPAWMGVTPRRCTARRRAQLSLGERMVGAVPAGESARFHVWAEGELRSLRLLAAVGTLGRLRLHRLPLPQPSPPGAPAVGLELLEPREPVVP